VIETMQLAAAGVIGAGAVAAAAYVRRRRRAASQLRSPVLTAGSFVLVPYGVLGTRLTAGGLVDTGSEPTGGNIAIVDPAGLPYIQDLGPSMAGAASGAIYQFLGIRDRAAFPTEVSEAITADGEAKHHAYTLPDGTVAHCIHVVGPDFRVPSAAEDEDPRAHALGRLVGCYSNVLKEFDASGAHTLRLLPISGGVFAGPWRGEMPQLTREALGAACAAMPEGAATRLGVGARRFELCIFMEAEWDGFVEAGFSPEPAASL